MSESGSPSSWEKTESELAADCKIFKVFRSRFRHPVRGDEGEFYALDASDWITVVAITEDEELVAVRQFRFGIEALSLEVPAGVMDPGEDPLTTGVRELREETGYVGDQVELLGWVYPNPAIQTNRCFVVGVQNARRVADTDWDEHEELQTELIPWNDIKETMNNGEFRHALSICALNFYQLKHS